MKEILISCLLWLSLAPVRANEPAWLNAADFGASGSKFETKASIIAGSKQIAVKSVGDFKVGQGVMVSKANPRIASSVLWGPHKDYARSSPAGDRVQLRGYDGSAGSWVVFVLDVPAGSSQFFRWTDDLGRTWHEKIPMTGNWQSLGGGMEVRFGKHDWEAGYTATFIARDQLVTTIEKIEGNTITLKDPITRAVGDADVRHNDTSALQAVVDRAIKERKNVLVPPGNYRLSGPITLNSAAAITIQGQNAPDTVLDISEGEGSCIQLKGGTEVTIRNFSMLGHMGFDESDRAGLLRTLGGTAVWGFYFKKCNALGISGTERVLVENCHARRMSAECFYSSGNARVGDREPKAYTKSITYQRCSVVDCARNAFNNNDYAENTSVLHCRIVDVGGCTWEGASRFVRFIGNYVRNAGTIAMGNIRSRAEHLEQLGSGQHIVADNVFEGRTCYGGHPGGYIVRACDGATQVIIRNNLFVNYNSCGIEIVANPDPRSLPTSNCTVTGNIMDMTAIGEPSRTRTAIHVGCSDVILSDNQIYARDACDPNVTALSLTEPAVNLTVHDNLLRNCGAGIGCDTASSLVGEIVDQKTFTAGRGKVPMERRQSHRYRDFNLVWICADKPAGQSVIETFDPETLRFTIKEPREIKAGDRFEIFSPSANWNLHDNTISGCAQAVVFNNHGSDTSMFRNNLIERGGATNAAQAVVGTGKLKMDGNHIVGFDEKKSNPTDKP